MNFESLIKDKFNFSMKPQQRDAILNTTGPMLLLAVPGSGKTTVTALRCANLALCSGVAPGMLAFTHDPSSRDDLEERISSFLDPNFPRNLLVTTMVDFCSFVMKEYAALVGIQPPKQIESSKRRLLRNIYAQINGGEYLPDNQLDEIAASISKAKHDMERRKKAGRAGNETGKFARIAAAYEAYMHTNQCADFDEIQAGALAALSERSDLLEMFRKRFPYINVDDAQELSKLQFEILKILAAPHNNLFLAGNKDQRLNRTACPACLGNFNQIYPRAMIFKMERNYRSTHAIVDAANRLIQYNAMRDMNAMNTGNEIGMPVEETALAESGMLGGHIISRLKDLPDPGNAAIIYRKNTSAAAIIDALDREGIPFRLRDPECFCFDHWVAQDILSFMALARNPEDITALKRIYCKFNTYVSKEALGAATAVMGDKPYISALDALLCSSEINETTSARIGKLKVDIVNLPAMSPDAAINFILDKLEYGEYLKKTCGNGMYLESLLQIVESLAVIASKTENYSQLLARIGELNKAMGRACKSTDQNAVMIASAHMTKGMEFKHVYIIDVCEGSIPSLEAISNNGDDNKELMEEERRLFYVAITRASKYAELIYARKANGNRIEPSRFIGELLHREIPRRGGAGKAGGRTPRIQQRQPPSGKSPVVKKPDVIRLAAQKPPAFEHFDPIVGMPVEHKSFGRGIVSAYDGNRDILAVRFEKSGLKKFAASYCINGGVMQKASGESASHPSQFEKL